MEHSDARQKRKRKKSLSEIPATFGAPVALVVIDDAHTPAEEPANADARRRMKLDTDVNPCYKVNSGR